MTNALRKTVEDYDPRLYSDVMDLFRGRRQGHVGHWQYSSPMYFGDPVRGAMYWERFLSSSTDYYVMNDEVELIRGSLRQLRSQLGKCRTLVDFGCGPTSAVIEKVFPILKALEVSNYVPVDVCERYATDAARHARSFSVPSATPLAANFVTDKLVYPSQGPVLGLLFGATVTNDPAGVRPYLQKIKPALGAGSVLLVAYDSNQNEDDILRSYLHPDQIAFGSNLMFRIERDLPVSGVRPFRWSYTPIWDAENFCLQHTVAPSHPVSFVFGSEAFHVTPQDRFVLNTSYKYPARHFAQEAQKAGFRTRFVLNGKADRVVLHGLEVM